MPQPDAVPGLHVAGVQVGALAAGHGRLDLHIEPAGDGGEAFVPEDDGQPAAEPVAEVVPLSRAGRPARWAAAGVNRPPAADSASRSPPPTTGWPS